MNCTDQECPDLNIMLAEAHENSAEANELSADKLHNDQTPIYPVFLATDQRLRGNGENPKEMYQILTICFTNLHRNWLRF